MVSGLCESTYAIQDGAKNKIWIMIKIKIGFFELEKQGVNKIKFEKAL